MVYSWVLRGAGRAGMGWERVPKPGGDLEYLLLRQATWTAAHPQAPTHHHSNQSNYSLTVMILVRYSPTFGHALGKPTSRHACKPCNTAAWKRRRHPDNDQAPTNMLNYTSYFN